VTSATLRQLARLRARHGIEVTITRGQQNCTLIAVPAKSTAKVVGSDGSYSVITVEDWLIAADEWDVGEDGDQYPQKGDDINASGSRYYVTHPDDKTPVFANFNQLDRPAVAWRVHSMPR
jgi:hypothetical protein